jgi:hypothetical protein
MRVSSRVEEPPLTTYPLDWPTTNTQHGLLVAFGEFLTQHGLLERLRDVPINQKVRDHSPQTKLIEFLAGIMSGIERLSDLNAGPRPLVRDAVVARAWGVPGFAHYSGVSRTLAACDEETIVTVEAAIAAFNHPFIETGVSELLRRGVPIVYDLDLTGQAVSATSTTYPDAAFGWMNDHVRLGYQLARVCLSTATGERLWLAGFHHPGDTVSARCLHELIQAAEGQAQVRPRRRVELVQQRIAAHQRGLDRVQHLIDQQQVRVDHLHATRIDLIGRVYHAHQVAAGAISPGKQARLQTQRERWQQRLPRVEAQIAQVQSVLNTHQARWHRQQAVLTLLRDWQAKLEADNQANPNPPPLVIARMDAGFSSGANLTWLLEMGYFPDTKAPNGQTTATLRAHLPPEVVWERVGQNAEMTLIGECFLHDCPFPLTAALERFKVGGIFHYATLIHYARDLPTPTLAAWFQHYNARQTIEAGNKEMKGTFFVQDLMSHSPAGIRLQVLFTGLATNAVRWCRPWLQHCVSPPAPQLIHALNSPKHMVRVAANSAALVRQTPSGMTVQFAPDSAFPDAQLCLRGIPAFQLPLAIYQPCDFASP